MSNEAEAVPTTKPRIQWRAWIGLLLVVACLAGAYAWVRSRRAHANDRLFAAIDHSDAAGVLAALDSGADPNARRVPVGRRGLRNMTGGVGITARSAAKGATALMESVDKPAEITRTLLTHGADVNLIGCDHGEWDALMHAANTGSLEVTKLLLDKSANVDHADQVGRSALVMATARGRTEIVSLLLDYNANPNVQDLSGMSPLLIAMYQAPEKERIKCMDILLDHNAISDTTMHGMSALSAAIMRDMPDVVDVLLKHNASVNGMFVNGKSPFQLAKDGGNKRIIAAMIKAGASDPESTKDTKTTKDSKGNAKAGVAR